MEGSLKNRCHSRRSVLAIFVVVIAAQKVLDLIGGQRLRRGLQKVRGRDSEEVGELDAK